MNKKFLFGIIVALLSLQCKQTPENNLQKRWVFTELETPYSQAMAKAFSPEIIEQAKGEMRQLVKGNRLILEDTGHFHGVLLNEYVTGNWRFNEFSDELITNVSYPKKLSLRWLTKQENKKVLQLKIRPGQLQDVRTTNADSSLFELEDNIDDQRFWIIKAEKEIVDFDDKNPDPWSTGMNQWRIKPMRPESATQMQVRMRNHLEFLYSFFSFASNGERYWVSQDWFFSVLKPGSNGIAVVSKTRITPKWETIFYDSTQAMEGYKMLRKLFDADIKVPEKESGVELNKSLLKMLLVEFDRLYPTK